MKMKAFLSAFSFALAQNVDLNSKIFETIEMDSRNYRNSFARSQESISKILLEDNNKLVAKKPASPTLLCWKCKAENMEICYEKGEIETCNSSEASCGLEERRWGGILVGVELGCKSRPKCQSDITANFIAATNQCRPTEAGHSVCRQCCSTDMCNRGWTIRSESGWQYDYIS